MSKNISYISAWVTYSRQTVDLGSLPADTYVLRAHCHVTTAFDGSGTDTVTVGSDADPDAIVTSVDVSTTGVKAVTLGVSAGYNASAQPLKIWYVNGSGEPSTGAALIILELAQVPDSPI